MDIQFAPGAEITLSAFQRLIREMYLEKDLARGVDGTFMWLMEEVGELAGALRTARMKIAWASLPTSWPGWRRSPASPGST